jgi:hypothetical protein
MSGDVYERLAAALDGLANGFPRTESNVELRILRHVFTPDEAAVAASLTGRPAVAAEVGHARQSRGARRCLDGLSRR